MTNMTRIQKNVIQQIQDHISKFDHWTLDSIEPLAGGAVSFRVCSDKWYQDSVMGCIGVRGGFKQWTLDKECKFHSKRENLRIVLDVYVR